MKLDDLTPLQRKCYDNWNSADFQGGSCQEIGRTWAAFSPSIDGVVPGVILVEDYLRKIVARSSRHNKVLY